MSDITQQEIGRVLWRWSRNVRRLSASGCFKWNHLRMERDAEVLLHLYLVSRDVAKEGKKK